MSSSALLCGTTTGAITFGPILNEIHITVTLSVRKRQKCQKTPTIRSPKLEASNYCHPKVQQVWWVVTEYLDIIKYKPSAFFRKLCDSCMSVHALSFPHGCTHLSLGLRLDLGNSLDRCEGESARAVIHGIQSFQKKDDGLYLTTPEYSSGLR